MLTGGAGFIGRVVLERLLARGDYVYMVDALTYAADPDILKRQQLQYAGQVDFVCNDIRELGRLPDVEAVIHCAAETHVDNSIDMPDAFVGTNIAGTAHLLELTRRKAQHGMPHFIHLSTDEVYGSLSEGRATPDSPLRPSSPYAASKAAADLLVQSWGQTFGVPYTIVRPTNTYGPLQYPEKLIPKAVRQKLLGRPMTIHGDGRQTRCWLAVEDLADAILMVLDEKVNAPIVNVGGNTTASVNEVVDAIGYNQAPVLQFTRAAMDERYAVDDSILRAAGWAPKGSFWSDLPGLVEADSARFRF